MAGGLHSLLAFAVRRFRNRPRICVVRIDLDGRRQLLPAGDLVCRVSERISEAAGGAAAASLRRNRFARASQIY